MKCDRKLLKGLGLNGAKHLSPLTDHYHSYYYSFFFFFLSNDWVLGQEMFFHGETVGEFLAENKNRHHADLGLKPESWGLTLKSSYSNHVEVSILFLLETRRGFRE